MIIVCNYCGEEFDTNEVRRRKYCSEECRIAAKKEYYKEYRLTYTPPTTPSVAKPKPIPYCQIPQICVVCQKEFFPKHGNQICCSEACSIERAKQSRKRHKRRTQANNSAWHTPLIIEPQRTCEKRGIEYETLTADQKIYYSAVQLNAYADSFKVFIPKGLKSVNERKRESI